MPAVPSGHGERRAEPVPRLVANLAAIEIVRVACGGHTCALGSHGELFTFGNGKHGQLGHGEQRAEPTPRQVQALRHTRVLGIAAGDFHTLALADDGNVYTWGSGAYGELGHGDRAHQSEPRRVEALQRRNLVFAACGASHSLLLLEAGGGPEPPRGGGELWAADRPPYYSDESSDDESASTRTGRGEP